MGMKKILIYDWKVEHKKLTAEKDKLYKEFYHRKESVRKAELIQKSVDYVLRGISRDSYVISPMYIRPKVRAVSKVLSHIPHNDIALGNLIFKKRLNHPLLSQS